MKRVRAARVAVVALSWVLLSVVTAMSAETAPLRHKTAAVNGVELHYVEAGQGPLILFLHGFPEFWYAWKDSLAEFGKDHHAVAVDMRGYNLSSKPERVEDYRMPHLVGDVAALIGHLEAEKAVLVGHDWGGAVAWAFALAHPEMLERLVIINAPHPAVFAREIAGNPEQQQASGYMNLFRSPEAEAVLSKDNYAWLRQIFASQAFSDEDRQAYLAAWSQPGALTGGLNYYRANIRQQIPAGQSGSQTAPPGEADELPAFIPPATELPLVEVATLVVWGEQDRALLTGNLDGLEKHVREIEIRRIPDGSHWVVHEQPQQVHRLIREFLEP